MLYYIILYNVILYYNLLYCFILHHIMLYYVIYLHVYKRRAGAGRPEAPRRALRDRSAGPGPSIIDNMFVGISRIITTSTVIITNVVVSSVSSIMLTTGN